MAARVSLRDVVDELDMLTDESTAYLNRKTGELCTIQDDDIRLIEDDRSLDDLPEWQRDDIPRMREVLESEDWLILPTRFDIHEWAIMDEFARSVDNPDLSYELMDAIRGTGAFRCFRNAIHLHGIQESCYQYKDAALAEIAIEWLDEHGIPYARET